MKTIVKNTKKIVLINILVLSGGVSMSAQKSGVFKSYIDFESDKMEYAIDCATEKHKIRLNDFFGLDYITVIHDGKSYKLKKSEIWGYQLCDQKTVRFQVNEEYALTDKSVIWLYSKQITIPGTPKAGGAKVITKYYFSKEGDGKIFDLTLFNLKSSFPDNHKLHDALDEAFKSDIELTEYDDFHKEYKINHFLDSFGIK